jgi:hypothetical protein
MKKSGIVLSIDFAHTGAASSEYLRVRDKTVAKARCIEKLGEDVWLIPLPEELPYLSQLISVAEYASLKYRTLHIDHDPVWVSYGGNKSDIS